MTGTSQSCNHVIAVLYKTNYAYQKGYLGKACTDIPYNWNQGTKKDVQPKMVCDIKLVKNVCKKHEH